MHAVLARAGVPAMVATAYRAHRAADPARWWSAWLDLWSGLHVPTAALAGALYVHLLRPAGQAAAEKVAAAIPRAVRRGDHAGSKAVPGPK